MAKIKKRKDWSLFAFKAPPKEPSTKLKPKPLSVTRYYNNLVPLKKLMEQIPKDIDLNTISIRIDRNGYSRKHSMYLIELVEEVSASPKDWVQYQQRLEKWQQEQKEWEQWVQQEKIERHFKELKLII
jgi:hypothetical protein